MVSINNHLGTINYTKQFFYTLIGGTVSNCFGVVDMNAGDVKQTFIEKVPIPFIKKFAEKTILSEKGVTVRFKNGKLYIDLHITVMYGVNVSTIVKSIIHKVRYAVEEETEFSVEKVNVFVDSVKI
ncbi:MAG: Asp23/Gls24 family envelope stress response protein [Ruminiclostridium sp.]|nr:Asp23/Gls24 family envelope stress response protein [Ruminiclostridium sp.]MBQ8932575.1 Asp23/Gls24 family envelope stress response protein [Ruminiclostridium sp.]